MPDANTAPARWYVRVDETVYGPFTDAVLAEYLDEGRVTAQSFVRHGTLDPFRQVATIPALMAHLQEKTPSKAATQSAKACLVMAEIRSGQAMRFLQTLQSLGEVQRIGQTVWLLRSAATPSQITETLSPPLGMDDRLFVVEVQEAAHSGFNLGREIDGKLKSMLSD